MTSCIGCKYHYQESHLLGMLLVDFCGRDGGCVGLECRLGVIATEGCSRYERPFSWPPGAIS